MSQRRTRNGQVGQATVEHLGVAAIVALLVASLSLWVAANVRTPPPPPPIIASIANALDEGPPGVPDHLYRPHANPLSAMRAGGDAPIGGFLREAGRLARDAVTIGGPAFARGFLVQIKERAADMARNPIGTIKDTIEGLSQGDLGVLAVIRERIGDIGVYVETLRGLSREEMIRKVAGDLGAVGADVAIFRGRTLLVKKGIGKLRERASRPAERPAADLRIPPP